MKLKAAGLPMETRIHDLRHSHVSWLIRSGQDIKPVQALAGHAQACTKLEIYSHLLPGYNREAADKYEGMFEVDGISVGIRILISVQNGQNGLERVQLCN